ncbi:MAG: 3-phosphoglycerate dehydrogenase, partial [Lachnospiraceae bacterium]|nr:3-phosphoglycerate dehydrogenase [Lachnospiraceae bacterium]
IARAGAGMNNIPLDRAAEKGIVVFNTPGANANAVKELTLAALLLVSCDILGGIRWVNDNRDDENLSKSMEKAKARFAGNEILNKTIGVIGLGAIGLKVARSAAALGMHVIGYDPHMTNFKGNKLNEAIEVADSPAEVYADADFVTIHIPEVPETKNFWNRDAFSLMKDDVTLLNLARAGLVNEADLKEALESGKVARYVTDVPTHFTANLPNVLAFPHLGASTEEAEDNCAVMAAEELKAYLECGNIINSVNYPKVTLQEKRNDRVGVLFSASDETSGAIGKIMEGAAERSQSGVRNSYGYALFEGKGVHEKSAALEAVPGVIRVLMF